jgi:DNA-binding GntR family transcriptional regulator
MTLRARPAALRATQARSLSRRRILLQKGDTKAHRIHALLSQEIVAGRLRPGTKLDEEEMAARYGGSRTPVREALKQLASERLVELRPHAGAFVAKLTITELAEMFEVMAFLEGACAAVASRRHTAQDRSALVAAHEACGRAAKRDDPDAFYAANKRFHECIYHASHNEYLRATTVSLRNRLETYRREATFHQGLMAISMVEHGRILEAILRMDEGAAATHMRSHLDTLRDDAVSMVSALPHSASGR